jgi:hypothetical protein
MDSGEMARSNKPKILYMTMHTTQFMDLCKGVKPALRKYAFAQKHK